MIGEVERAVMAYDIELRLEGASFPQFAPNLIQIQSTLCGTVSSLERSNPLNGHEIGEDDRKIEKRLSTVELDLLFISTFQSSKTCDWMHVRRIQGKGDM
jgi:hypothetical protein